MVGRPYSTRSPGWFSLTVLCAALLPASADAAWLGYKNDTAAAVIIQSADSVIVGGKQQLRPGKPHPLYPGEVAWDAIAAPGPRIIVVYDPKQNNRELGRAQVDLSAKDDIFLSL